MGRIAGVCLILAALAAAVAAAPTGAPQVAAEVNLEKLAQGKRAVNVDAGHGVTLRIMTEPAKFLPRQKLLILERNTKIKELEEGKYTAFTRVEAGPSTYWVIAEFTGGAHCCGVYHFLSRPRAGQAVGYLGQTQGHNGGPQPPGKLVIHRNGQLYFHDLDNRFDYFHSSHAGSLLVNLPPRFYHLTPSSLQVSNQAFKDVYLQGAAAADQEIQKAAASRPARPPAIFQSEPGDFFTDNLGQLLVKRTLFYLYAREDRKAWESLERDVTKYYRTTQGLKEIEREIGELLGQGPY